MLMSIWNSYKKERNEERKKKNERKKERKKERFFSAAQQAKPNTNKQTNFHDDVMMSSFRFKF